MFNSNLKSRVKMLEESLNHERRTCSGYRDQVRSLKDQLGNAENTGRQIEKERDELKKLVIDECHGQLLINALKASGIIRDPEKPATNYVGIEQSLRQNISLAQASNASMQYGFLSGLTGGILR